MLGVNQSEASSIGSGHRQFFVGFPILHPRYSLVMIFLPLRICRLTIRTQSKWRHFATLNTTSREDTGQNLTEKIVQRYAVDLPPGKIVKSGDYVSIKPEHCMSHDNCTAFCEILLTIAWPVAMKYLIAGVVLMTGLWESVQQKF
jgi:hypothetical protein